MQNSDNPNHNHHNCNYSDMMSALWTLSGVLLLTPPRTLCFIQHLSFCLSVCSLATLTKNYRTDLREILPQTYLDNEELIKVWKGSASGFRSGNFQKNSSTLQHRTLFPLLGSDLQENFITNASLDDDVPIKLWKSPRSRSDQSCRNGF